MDNFIYSINVTIPIFLVILLGWVLKKINIITDEFAETANKYVFKAALPVLLFKDIASTSILDDMNWKFVLFCFLATFVMFTGVWIFAHFYCRNNRESEGAFAQAAARGSAAVLGIAFVENICGDAGMAPLMIVAAVPLFNVYSVIILTFCGRDKTKGLQGIKKAFINILKNPIIIGILLGIPFSVFDISIPVIFSRTIDYVAQTATPIALIAVGAGFSGDAAIKKLKPALIASFIKLVVLPLIFVSLAICFGFNSSEIVAVLIMSGAPTTVTCYIMAKNMNNDETLSSNVIVLTTVLSSITLTLWIFVLKSMGAI